MDLVVEYALGRTKDVPEEHVGMAGNFWPVTGEDLETNRINIKRRVAGHQRERLLADRFLARLEEAQFRHINRGVLHQPCDALRTKRLVEVVQGKHRLHVEARRRRQQRQRLSTQRLEKRCQFDCLLQVEAWHGH